MKRATLLAVAFSTISVYAGLDRIDADGVTETGGAPYARMLTRTGSDGKLSASLLPPVADWASQPISGLYYVSGGAASEGNGSPQYPFKTLTYAAAHASSGSALLLVPATYSGTLSVPAGSTVTLCGIGPSTRISTLAVTASGDNASTELRLCGVAVGTLVLAGGRINVRLAASTVSTMSGSSSHVTVTRSDLGSYVSTAGMAYTDSYAGYDTVPKSLMLSDSHDSLTNLVLTGGRAVFHSPSEDETVAYLSDVKAATNIVYETIGELRGADESLADALEYEAGVRTNADIALSQAVSNAVDTLSGQITLIDNRWSDQVTTLSGGISDLRSDYNSLWTRETNDIHTVTTRIDAVIAGYKSADTQVKTYLTGVISDRINDVEDEIPGIADERSIVQIGYATNAIIAAAVDQAMTNTGYVVSGINDRITNLADRITSLAGASRTNTDEITGIKNDVIDLDVKVDDLEESVEDDVDDLYAKIASEKYEVTLSYKAADTTLSSSLKTYADEKAAAVAGTIEDTANDCIDAKKNDIIAAAKADAKTYTDNAIATYSDRLGAAEEDIATLEDTVFAGNSGVGALGAKINVIIDCLSQIQKKESFRVPAKIP